MTVQTSSWDPTKPSQPDPVEVFPPCLCGCGEQTRGGEFRPGHDAKYKSHLLKEAAAGGNPEAERILEERGWTKFLIKYKEVQARPPKVKPAKFTKPSTLQSLELLALMKAAVKVLKWTGQYTKTSPSHIMITPHNAAGIASLTHPDLLLRTDTAHEPFTDKEQAALDRALASPAP